MIEKSKPDLLAQRISEAVAWHTYLHELDLSTTPEFETWLGDPDNAHVWGQTVAIWDFVGTQAREPETVAARTAALNIVKRAMAQRRPALSRRRPVIAACVALLLVAAGSETYIWLQRAADYVSGFGERRVILLEDGSRISLDSDSEVTVQYSRTARELHLLRGQARFDVAHDVERPFSVVARDQKIVATGTAFNIDLTQPNVSVTLIEGHVVVLNEKVGGLPSMAPRQLSPKLNQVELRAGQELITVANKQPVVKVANIQQVTAWTSGQLIFSNETLADVVARVNHYSSAPIVIADPQIADEHLSGVFNTGDVSGFLDIVTQIVPVQISNDQSGRILLRKKS